MDVNLYQIQEFGVDHILVIKCFHRYTIDSTINEILVDDIDMSIYLKVNDYTRHGATMLSKNRTVCKINAVDSSRKLLHSHSRLIT